MPTNSYMIKTCQKLPMLTFNHQNRIPVYKKIMEPFEKIEQTSYRKDTCAATPFQTPLLYFSSSSLKTSPLRKACSAHFFAIPLSVVIPSRSLWKSLTSPVPLLPYSSSVIRSEQIPSQSPPWWGGGVFLPHIHVASSGIKRPPLQMKCCQLFKCDRNVIQK